MPFPQEPVSAFTHLFGALCVLAFAIPLWRSRSGVPGRRRVLGLFAASVAIQLGVSGIYHWQALGTPARAFLQRADHAAIWLVVVGCFLPIRHYLFPPRFGRILQAVICTVAVVGLLFETALADVIPSWVTVLLYVVFGSIGTPVALWLVTKRGLRYTLTFFLCGVSFSFAALIELIEEPVLIKGVVEYHEIVHVLVLAGFLFHWLFIAKLTRQARPRGAIELPADAEPASAQAA
ncbi:MAG: hemolysin III family protein [Planctomycetes bacterium]|nr:hemolysin III family protein [Planctomycetota bacterium]